MTYLIEIHDKEWARLNKSMYEYADKKMKKHLDFFKNIGWDKKDLVDFILNNTSYIHHHGLKLNDIIKAVDMASAVENMAFSSETVTKCDQIVFSDAWGRTYQNASYVGDHYKSGGNALVESGSIHLSKNDGDILLSVSGGGFPSFDAGDLKPAGTGKTLCWLWGTSGACANGGIYILPRVKKWTLKEK